MLRSKRTLTCHMQRNTDGEPYDCGDKRFATSTDYELKNHRQRPIGETPWACSICFAAFYLKQTFDYHMRMHGYNKPYVCDNCGKAFAARNELTATLPPSFRWKTISLRHARDQILPICSSHLPSESALQVHIRTRHTGETPYTSDECGRAFASK